MRCQHLFFKRLKPHLLTFGSCSIIQQCPTFNNYKEKLKIPLGFLHFAFIFVKLKWANKLWRRTGDWGRPAWPGDVLGCIQTSVQHRKGLPEKNELKSFWVFVNPECWMLQYTVHSYCSHPTSPVLCQLPDLVSISVPNPPLCQSKLSSQLDLHGLFMTSSTYINCKGFPPCFIILLEWKSPIQIQFCLLGGINTKLKQLI